MCHLLLLMPILGIPVFWIWPLATAIPAYTVIVGLSAWLYYYVIKSMRRPVVSGQESMMHSTGEVVGKHGNLLHVRVQSEIWEAESTETLQTSDHVEVIGIRGLRLKVRRLIE